MGENTKIEWCDMTFNPWIGCSKLSAGCQNCYALDLMETRYKRVKWGPQGTRQRTSAANWRKPLQWNRQAQAEGRRYRVFCASLADVFEDRPELIPWRNDLFALIEQTPRLDWLLLTKRPENITEMFPTKWRAHKWGKPPENIWFGTSVENQEAVDKRIPALLKIDAKVRFLSCEPLLGPVDLKGYIYPQFAADDPRHYPWRDGVEWVIAGGESGHNARPAHPDWFRSLRDQCVLMCKPFLFKQWGEWASVSEAEGEGAHFHFEDGATVRKVGKHAAGRLLDGREWSEFPE